MCFISRSQARYLGFHTLLTESLHVGCHHPQQHLLHMLLSFAPEPCSRCRCCASWQRFLVWNICLQCCVGGAAAEGDQASSDNAPGRRCRASRQQQQRHGSTPAQAVAGRISKLEAGSASGSGRQQDGSSPDGAPQNTQAGSCRSTCLLQPGTQPLCQPALVKLTSLICHHCMNI